MQTKSCSLCYVVKVLFGFHYRREIAWVIRVPAHPDERLWITACMDVAYIAVRHTFVIHRPYPLLGQNCPVNHHVITQRL